MTLGLAWLGLLFGLAARAEGQAGFYCTEHAQQHLVFGGTGQECADAMPAFKAYGRIPQSVHILCSSWDLNHPLPANRTWSLWGGSNGVADDDDYQPAADCGEAIGPLNLRLGNGQAFMCADEIISLLDMAACTGIIRQLTTGIAAEASPVLAPAVAKSRTWDIMGSKFYCSGTQFAFGGTEAECGDQALALQSFLGLAPSSLTCMSYAQTGEVTYTWGIWGGRGYSTHDAANNDDSGDDYAQQQDCTDAMGSLNYKLGTTTFNCASPRTTDTSMYNHAVPAKLIAVTDAATCNAKMAQLNDALVTTTLARAPSSNERTIAQLAATVSQDYVAMTDREKSALIRHFVVAVNARVSPVVTTPGASFSCSAAAQQHLVYSGSYLDCARTIPAFKAYLGVASTVHLQCSSWDVAGPVNMTWAIWGGSGGLDDDDDYQPATDCRGVVDRLNLKLGGGQTFLCADGILSVLTNGDCNTVVGQLNAGVARTAAAMPHPVTANNTAVIIEQGAANRATTASKIAFLGGTVVPVNMSILAASIAASPLQIHFNGSALSTVGAEALPSVSSLAFANGGGGGGGGKEKFSAGDDVGIAMAVLVVLALALIVGLYIKRAAAKHQTDTTMTLGFLAHEA